MNRTPKLLASGLLLFAAPLLLVLLADRRRECRPAEPDRLAALETAGWAAYYARDWPRVLWLMVQTNRTQFCMGWSEAVPTALDVVQAAAAFAPVDNDIPAATAHLTRFYAKAGTAANLATDAATLAALEVDYWIVHRRLANERKVAPGHTGDLAPMVAALERLHRGLFDAPPAVLRASAAARAEAAATVDRITGGYSRDLAADWQAVEASLRTAYEVLAPYFVSEVQ